MKYMKDAWHFYQFLCVLLVSINGVSVAFRVVLKVLDKLLCSLFHYMNVWPYIVDAVYKYAKDQEEK